MAAAHEEEWGTAFAEMMQDICNKLSAGNKNALSDFMYNATTRVLSDIPSLVLPGA